MSNVPTNPTNFDMVGAITLTGCEVATGEADILMLEMQGGLLKIRRGDLIHSSKAADGSVVVRIPRDAKIVYETIISPDEADGILAQRASVQFVDESLRNRCVECSRCSGGECECSRCVDSMRNRCVECSRCTGGECECSRCVEAGFGSLPGRPESGFRRRLT